MIASSPGRRHTLRSGGRKKRQADPVQKNPRKGFHSVTPRLVVADAEALIASLRTLFDTKREQQGDRTAELRLTDSLIMVTPAAARARFPAFASLSVANV